MHRLWGQLLSLRLWHLQFMRQWNILSRRKLRCQLLRWVLFGRYTNHMHEMPNQLPHMHKQNHMHSMHCCSQHHPFIKRVMHTPMQLNVCGLRGQILSCIMLKVFWDLWNFVPFMFDYIRFPPKLQMCRLLWTRVLRFWWKSVPTV